MVVVSPPLSASGKRASASRLTVVVGAGGPPTAPSQPALPVVTTLPPSLWMGAVVWQPPAGSSMIVFWTKIDLIGETVARLVPPVAGLADDVTELRSSSPSMSITAAPSAPRLPVKVELSRRTNPRLAEKTAPPCSAPFAVSVLLKIPNTSGRSLWGLSRSR